MKKRIVSALTLVLLSSWGLASSAFATDTSTAQAHKPLQAYAVTVVESSHSQFVKGNGVRPAAVATPTPVYFTPQAPSYKGNTQYSHFTGQVNYGSSKLTFAWSDTLNAQTYGLAAGLMNETATATANGKATGYKDTHTGILASYTVHSSFTVTTKSYVLTINENFPIAKGTEYVTTQFAFYVSLI